MSAAVPNGRRFSPAWRRGHARRLQRAIGNGRLPAFLMAIISAFLLFGFLSTDDFRIESVKIDGVQYGDVNEVIESADVLNRSAFRVQPDAVAARVADLPFVEAVRVDVTYPGQARIVIDERSPSFVIDRDGEQSLVSDDGVQMATGVITGLPVLSVAQSSEPAEGFLDADLVHAVQAIAAAYGPDLSLAWTARVGLSMTLLDERLVIFGEPVDIDEKLAVLDAIADQIHAPWVRVDLRVPSRPAYR